MYATREQQEVLRAGPLEVLPGDAMALIAGRPLNLSVRELAVLTELARRRDRIVSREALYQAAWSSPLRQGDRSVDVYVSQLRTKLRRKAPGWRFIHTHVGFGYRFSPESTSELGGVPGAAA